ncbi:MAG TPA: hypothetical protein VMU33_05940 [Burkholderiaceae bacterium]|nr:hypothetical protein [Burkholderiaceae bacterium]
MFLLDTWHVAARSDEIAADRPLGRRICNRPVALFRVVDFITPETDTSIHYFWGMARRFLPDDEAVTARIREGQARVFAEDTQMLERQQRNLSEHPGRSLLMLNIDSGGVQARRVIDRLLAAEAAR